MALSGEQLFKASQFAPASYGAVIVDPSADEVAQQLQAINYINSDILPGANSEVSVPFRLKTGHSNIGDFIEARYPTMDAWKKASLIFEGESLFDAAVKSYGRSELNKIVDSNAESYDKDSDQDRIQGNQRLQKLLDWAAGVVSMSDGGSFNPDANANRIPRSQSVRIVPTW